MLEDAREETVFQTGDGEPDTKDAEALASALNHSAERVQTLWFSFLTVMLYLAIATGTTTHRMLFLESPLKLPVLNIDLPLLGFYILTPIIFVVFHFYMLLNLVLLARTAKTFEDALVRAFPEDGEARENFRMRIENALFVQLLVGGRLEREGINAKFLSLMALITLALAPVALLLMIQIKFLPYHSEWITWLHRGLLALDLALVWTLWPGYRSGWGVRLWPKASWWFVVPGIGTAAALAYAAMVATFPDEQMYLATNWLHYPGAKVAPVNILDVNGEDLIDDAKLAHILEKNDRSRPASDKVATHLCAPVGLVLVDVRHVDFSDANLNRANLSFAWAERARFDHAQLRGASLFGAQLQGASLNHARLKGASLKLAELQGASLASAQLQGAQLYGAELQGAQFLYANLKGAVFIATQLQGASLEHAHLQGASLDFAKLQGATFEGAGLQGALLYKAQLQGALLDKVQLQGASFEHAFVWRADARKAIWKDTWVTRPEAGQIYSCRNYMGLKNYVTCDWTADTFEELKSLIAKEVLGGDQRRAAMEGIERRLDPAKALEGEKEMTMIWAALEQDSPTPDVYEKSLAEQWRATGCAADGAPYVLRVLLYRLNTDIRYEVGDVIYQVHSPFGDNSPEVPKLAAAFLDEAHCAGARGLSEADKAKLKQIAAPAAPLAPKP